MRTDALFLVVNMAARATKFEWTNGMVDDLLSSLLYFKSNMEYRNVHLNANKVKRYGAVREAMTMAHPGLARLM